MLAHHSETTIPAGPVDFRAARIIQRRYGKNIDASFLQRAGAEEGCIEAGAFFKDARGVQHRIGRLLPLVDNHSELPGPFQPSPEFPSRDRRIDWGVLTLLEEESPTAFALFSGERLIPFASLYCGGRHPDELRLGDGQANLVAFDYEVDVDRPAIVVWLAREASEAYDCWASRLPSNGFRELVPYSSFTVPVAANYDEFAAHLTDSALGLGSRRDGRGG